MNKFLIRTFTFLCLGFSINCVLFLSSHFFSKESLRYLKFDDSITTIICGDSHSQTALNDSLIPYSKNIAAGGEPIFYTYYRILNVLNNNPQIRRVILGLSFHNMSVYHDGRVWPKYFLLGDIHFFFTILKKNPTTFFNAFISHQRNLANNSWKFLFSKFSYEDFPFSSGYIGLNPRDLDSVSVIKIINRHYYCDGKIQGLSVIQRRYLDKIVAHCKNRKIDIIFVNTPKHEKYLKLVPDKFIKHHYEVIRQYPNVIYLDHHNYYLDDEYFCDYDHLNYKGALLYTTEFRKLLDELHHKILLDILY